MKFEEVLPALREGKKIRRKCMSDKYYRIDNNHIYDNIGQLYTFGVEADILQDDWEIVEEKKKVKLRDLTEGEYKKWEQINCSSNKCNDCVFNKGDCIYNAFLWIKDKSLFSDKFLDQEVEIEDGD